MSFQSTGTIKYPLTEGTLYPNNAKCSWTITVDPDMSVSLKFTKFSLEPKHGSRCSDYLEIFDGDSSTPMGSFCGKTIPEVPNTISNKASLYFGSDSKTQDEGFTVQWHSEKSSCGGRMTEDNGKIVSPGYPQEKVIFCRKMPSVRLELTTFRL